MKKFRLSPEAAQDLTEIIYSPDSTPLGIVAVLHGKRNIKRILRKRL